MKLTDAAHIAAIAAAVAAVAAIGAAMVLGSSRARGEPIAPGQVRVIDGDTVAVAAVTYRLVGFDAPETGERAQCASEAALGERATLKMRSIVAAGRLDLEPIACSCRAGTHGTRACNYGRACAVLRSAGRDVAAIMIRDGLARAYVCGTDRCPPRRPWCEDR